MQDDAAGEGEVNFDKPDAAPFVQACNRALDAGREHVQDAWHELQAGRVPQQVLQRCWKTETYKQHAACHSMLDAMASGMLDLVCIRLSCGVNNQYGPRNECQTFGLQLKAVVAAVAPLLWLPLWPLASCNFLNSLLLYHQCSHHVAELLGGSSRRAWRRCCCCCGVWQAAWVLIPMFPLLQLNRRLADCSLRRA